MLGGPREKTVWSHTSPCPGCGPSYGPVPSGALDRSPAPLGGNKPAAHPGQEVTGEAGSLCPLMRGVGGSGTPEPTPALSWCVRESPFPSFSSPQKAQHVARVLRTYYLRA